MAKYIVQIVILGSQIVGRAFAKAIRQEYAASQQAARAGGGGQRGAKSAEANLRTGISLDEALQILNVEKLDPEKIERNYELLFKANEKTQGGSFYIQSKIVSAKERVDEELEMYKSSTTKKKKTEDT